MVNPTFIINCVLLLSLVLFFVVEGQSKHTKIDNGWTLAHATFYGDINGDETLYGACGYNVLNQGYGLETTALSTALFNNGLACGSCFEIRCTNSKWCKKGAGSIRVTATNFCPPWYTETPQAWCNPPRKHFDLTMPMFLKIAEYKAGIVPVIYRKVTCRKDGGVKFELKGNPYWLMVLVYNVGGVGNVVGVNIKGSKSGWTQMKRNWGQNWNTWVRLQGEILSFEITTSEGKKTQFLNVAPKNWQFGQTYQAKNNM